MYEVKALNGNIHLGGEDIDNILVEYCINEFKRKTSIDINIRENPKAFQRIKTACEKAKKALSSIIKTTIDIDCIIGEEDLSVTITREIFENFCIGLFKKCILPLENLLKDAKINKNQIDEVIMVGGSTRIPKVREMVQEFFYGKQLNYGLNPEETIAYGAAIQAAVLTGVKEENLKNIILLDVTPFSLGVETVGGVMTVLIPKNTTTSCIKHKIIDNYSDNQTSFIIHVYEGERQLTKDNNFLGKFEVDELPMRPRGQLHIKITFDIDANSILSVSAFEETTGKKNSLNTRNSINRFSIEDIDRMVLEYEKLYEEEKEKEESKINFDFYFYGIRQAVKDLQSKNKFSENEKNQIREKINEIFDWRNNNIKASKDEYDAKVKEMGAVINPIMQKLYMQDNDILKGEKQGE